MPGRDLDLENALTAVALAKENLDEAMGRPGQSAGAQVEAAARLSHAASVVAMLLRERQK